MKAKESSSGTGNQPANGRWISLGAIATIVVLFGLYFAGGVFSKEKQDAAKVNKGDKAAAEKVVKKDAEWKKELTPLQYHIVRDCGTEPAFTGKYVNNHEKGVYYCVACGNPLFDSTTKFDSGTGWPSFYQPLKKESVEERQDYQRKEVVCNKCEGHLGHVFPDGPAPTKLRYCINSAALDFKKKDGK